jgi:transcription initiation factor TFIIIB Brf1 subunit/transcription initiation factor TFIIB
LLSEQELSEDDAKHRSGSMKEVPNKKKEKCPECGGTEFCYDDQTGETYCKSCSLVIDQKVDDGKDYTAGEDGGEGKRRHGPPGRYIDGGSIGSTF